MRESPFGFEYSWADLEPIRPLVWIVLAVQVIGALLGLTHASHDEWFHRLWFGGAIVTLPGFLVGLPVQYFLRPGSIGEHFVMVRRLGLIAAALSIAAVFMPPIKAR
jgi:hypothetical protein